MIQIWRRRHKTVIPLAFYKMLNINETPSIYHIDLISMYYILLYWSYLLINNDMSIGNLLFGFNSFMYPSLDCYIKKITSLNNMLLLIICHLYIYIKMANNKRPNPLT